LEIRAIGPFLKYFGNVRERTMRVARCVPPDKVGWSYAPGKFTLGDLLRHIAVTERYLFAENIQSRTNRYTTHGPELAASLDAILPLMERLHVESMEIFGKLTDEDLARKIPGAGGERSACRAGSAPCPSTRFITAGKSTRTSGSWGCRRPLSTGSPRRKSALKANPNVPPVHQSLFTNHESLPFLTPTAASATLCRHGP
jgi:hypothetical protein